MPLPPARQLSRPARYALLALGHAAFITGLIGAFLPVLPTVIFWIVAAWAFGHASPALQARLFAMPGAGRHVEAWLLRGEISRRGKCFATAGMLAGWLSIGWVTHWEPLLLIPAGLLMLGVAIWLWRKPEPDFSSASTAPDESIQCPVFTCSDSEKRD